MVKWRTGTPPQKSGRYLVTFKLGSKLQVRTADRIKYPSMHWWYWKIDGCEGIYPDVIAWKRCPEPYRDAVNER